ncbi:hypothetical protein ACFWFF_38580, partial [Streptomyces sp. NPDC060223]
MKPGSLSRSTIGDPRQLHPYFFDCLHLDGVDLIDEPLRVRRVALEQVAG